MKRRFVRYLTGVSLLLTVALAVIWFYRLDRGDNWYWSGKLPQISARYQGSGWSCSVYSNKAGVCLFATWQDGRMGAARPGRGFSFDAFRGAELRVQRIFGFGFGCRTRGYWDIDYWAAAFVAVAMPYWFLIIATLALPAWQIWILAFPQRHVGVCQSCGYDLRGSIGQPTCPECGTTIVTAPASDDHAGHGATTADWAVLRGALLVIFALVLWISLCVWAPIWPSAPTVWGVLLIVLIPLYLLRTLNPPSR